MIINFEIGTDLPLLNITSLPFKGRVGVGMGFFSIMAPHPPPDLPLEGGGTWVAGDWF
jgi:hypothetical protein